MTNQRSTLRESQRSFNGGSNTKEFAFKVSSFCSKAISLFFCLLYLSVCKLLLLEKQQKITREFQPSLQKLIRLSILLLHYFNQGGLIVRGSHKSMEVHHCCSYICKPRCFQIFTESHSLSQTRTSNSNWHWLECVRG